MGISTDLGSGLQLKQVRFFWFEGAELGGGVSSVDWSAWWPWLPAGGPPHLWG